MLNKFCRNYLWNVADGKKKLYMKSWASCCCPLEEGGFNIKEILSWNRANLCKWIWHMLNTQSLWTRWNEHYNLKNGTLWSVPISSHHAESWRGLLATRDFLLQFFGDSATANASLSSCVDVHGKFQVTKIYDLIRPHYGTARWAQSIWNANVLPKHSFISTMAIQKKLLTVDCLNRRGICLVNRCVLCQKACETHTHLFFKCEFSAALWRGLMEWMRLPGRSNDFWTELNWSIARHSRKHWKIGWFYSCLAAAVYTLWQERNTRLFVGKESSITHLIKQIQLSVGVKLLDQNTKATEEIIRHFNSIYV